MVRIELIGMGGEVVLSKAFRVNSLEPIELNLKGLVPGIYSCRISQNGVPVFGGKVAVMR